MERYAHEWCITLEELTRDDRTEADPSESLAPIISRHNYDAFVKRGKIKVVRQGKGKGNYALISYSSLPEALKAKLCAKYPDMEMEIKRASNPLHDLYREAYVLDLEARGYYYSELPRLNRSLDGERIVALAEEYTINASVIRAVQKLRRDNQLYCKVRGSRGCSWADMKGAIQFYQSEYGHTLGASPTRFASWTRAFEAEGYGALISKKFGNKNTLKVNMQVERLLLQMASDKHRPSSKTVWQWYCEFLRGEVHYMNPTTGEVYDPMDYPDLSEKVVGDYLASQTNQALLSKKHDARHDYHTTMRPHHKRIKPKYSLSMVSMDDKDLSLKIRWRKTTKKMVRGRMQEVSRWIDTALKAYFVYDVASEAIIGWAFSGDKDRDIFERCVRHMYRNLLSLGLGQPHEAQVENHIVSLYRDGMMRDGILFPKVTFAGAENSQEKYAERYNRNFKYQIEKLHAPEAVGRPFARLASNRTKGRKVSDGDNNNFETNEYSFEEAVRLYEEMIRLYNQEPHPKQKLYPGKTRLEVLLEYVHPEIKPIDMLQLTRHLGKSTETSIHRGQLRAGYEDYSVRIDQQDRLKGRDGKVTAYWWEQDEAEGAPADEILLYQDDIFLGVCPRIVPYQVSALERTREDMRRLGVQQARVRAWDEEIEALEPEPLIGYRTDQLEQIEAPKPLGKVAMPLEGDKELDEEEVERWINRSKDSNGRGLANL